MSLAELDFIPTATNIVFIGPTGVGKSGLATGLLLKALQNGYRALFIKAQDLFDDLYASLADRSSRKLVDRLARIPLLCIDEMGYLTLRPEQCNIFFKLMEERYRRRASMIYVMWNLPSLPNQSILKSSGLWLSSPSRKRKTHEQPAGSPAPRFHRITSNRDRAEWSDLFGEALLASAALDRLTHGAHFVEITGASFRAEHTKKQTATRRGRAAN
jgi:DNA replication protein DnaC